MIMEKYVRPEIRTIDIDSRSFMENPLEPPVNPISNVDEEGDGDQLGNTTMDDKFETKAQKSVWGPEE